MNTTETKDSLQTLLGLTAEPVAITFCEEAPQGMQRIGTAAPAGCSYWKLAAEGQAFYTEAADHFSCPIGAYTHGAEMIEPVKSELEGMIGKMVGIQYLKMEEVAGIPRRPEPLRFVAYGPLSRETGKPDVVLVRGNARQIMLLAEAATTCGLMSPLPVMGRPACAIVPATLASGKAATSLGCIGNRVYTGLPDGEFYLAVPGPALGKMIQALCALVAANEQLEQFHQSRCS